jgi:serine/threonine-protein kinase
MQSPLPRLLPIPGSAPLNETEERAFFQSRLAQYYFCGFALGVAQMVFLSVIIAFSGAPKPSNHLFGGSDRWYPAALDSAATLVTLVLWRILRRGTRSTRQLVAFDAGGTILVGLLIVAIHADVPAYLRPDIYTTSMIALVLAIRAVVVPSTPARTLAIAAVPFCVQAISSYFFYSVHHAVENAPAAGMYVAFDVILSGSWIAVTTLTSRALFGLRQKVRVAMQLGQYTLTEKLGEGGMGVVYKAQHAMLRRPTAVKLLPADKSNARDVARFEREVQLTSMLTHPNTIQIYDYGRTPEGTFYYAMEYLDGIDLESLVELDGPQPPARAIALLLQVCGSLAEAHSVGLIHRDIKPANILLCQRGKLADVVKVLDFGLVKVVGDEGLAHLSREGTIAGTPMYMAPEAIVTPERVDARADLYALGAVGYFLVTGRAVFEGNTVVEVCAHHLHTKPERPSARLGVPLPADFEDVIMWCLAKSPEKRPQDAEQLYARLLACSDRAGWSAEDGRGWWRSHEARIREHRGKGQTVSATIGPLASDLQARAAGGI